MVQLRSGGPLLTVYDTTKMTPSKLAVFTEATEYAGIVSCCWFTTEGDLRESEFLVDVLASITWDGTVWKRTVSQEV